MKIKTFGHVDERSLKGARDPGRRRAVHEGHNHYNFGWQEEHFVRTYWVIRKGCTPARPG